MEANEKERRKNWTYTEVIYVRVCVCEFLKHCHWLGYISRHKWEVTIISRHTGMVTDHLPSHSGVTWCITSRHIESRQNLHG